MPDLPPRLKSISPSTSFKVDLAFHLPQPSPYTDGWGRRRISQPAHTKRRKLLLWMSRTNAINAERSLGSGPLRKVYQEAHASAELALSPRPKK